MSLAGVAKETLVIVARGSYRAPSGAEVSVREAVDRAVQGTRLYGPEELDRLLEHTSTTMPVRGPTIEVTPESTAQAGRRLAQAEALPAVVALNFASAKNPGGGFLGGAKAQEEDLARCSALYTCQLTARDYYDANRACGSMLYTDRIIYSPAVPFFRDHGLRLLEQPFPLSIITAPAPNAGEALRRDPAGQVQIRATLQTRAGKVLAVAQDQGHRVLVLGAWGCGVFRNDPALVAEVFGGWLASPRFVGAFERVVFAIYDRSAGRATLRAFQTRFGS
ncbi:MAG TPA: TIGR02452 family protein [Polyangia bacterium]|nr:TIGR02452 family protein [Polyangia bacterium]